MVCPLWSPLINSLGKPNQQEGFVEFQWRKGTCDMTYVQSSVLNTRKTGKSWTSKTQVTRLEHRKTVNKLKVIVFERWFSGVWGLRLMIPNGLTTWVITGWKTTSKRRGPNSNQNSGFYVEFQAFSNQSTCWNLEIQIRIYPTINRRVNLSQCFSTGEQVTIFNILLLHDIIF